MYVTFGDFFARPAGAPAPPRGGAPHLEPKAFELLDLLIRRRPEGGREEGHPRPAVARTPSCRNRASRGWWGQIRQALGEDPKKPRYIRTVHAFGYAVLRRGHGWYGREAPPARDRRPAWVWGKWVVPLEDGENVFGREEDARVRIDSSGVSRRHARIVIRDGQATLEDMGSKNGTFLGERRLDAPVILADGDVSAWAAKISSSHHVVR